jgi:Zn-dependent peptidase ImmA (M78 family)
MTQQTDTFSVQVGDPDRVCLRLSMFPDPTPAPTGEADVDQTWGEFVLWVLGRNVTANQMWGESQAGIQWYLLPLLEWIVANWSPLLHEERPASLTEVDDAAHAVLGRRMPRALSYEEGASWFEERQEWLSRHDLSSASEGGRFPNLLLRRLRGDVEFSWLNDGVRDGFGFIEQSGSAIVDGREVADILHQVVSAAAAELMRLSPESLRYQLLAESAARLRDPVHVDERLAWLAGLAATGAQIIERWTSLAAAARQATQATVQDALFGGEIDPLYIGGSCHVALLFGSLSPTIGVSDARVIARHLVAAYGQRSPGRLEQLGDLTATPGKPWEEGYELAERVHLELGTDLEEPIRLYEILDALGVTYHNGSLSDPNARAFCFVSSSHRPTIVANTSYETNRFVAVRRTTMAHELCHLIFDSDRGRELAIASGPWAPLIVEQRANAFAAMFLMPEQLVRRSIADASKPPNKLDGIKQISSRMKTSLSTTIEHLHNLNQIDMVVREALLEELSRTGN